MLFAIGDYLAGMAIGALTALAVGVAVWPGMDLVIAVLLGMAIGMALHLIVGLLLAPLLGVFETLMPASLIGMYGGSLFAMRDAMAAGSPTYAAAAAVGAIFGIVVVLGVKTYSRVLRGPVLEVGN
jgi:hypothetical protein